MELRQIRYALTVARERGFTRAALRLNVSQSAVSEQVRLLEESIGFALFRRTGRGVEMTERGRTFLYEAERVIGDVLSLSDTARRLRGVAGDIFTLGIGSGMAQLFMPRLCRRLREVPPDVRLDILTAPTKSIFRDLHEERLDAGITIESDPDKVPSGLLHHRLAEVRLVLIVAPSHKLASAARGIDLGRLVAEPIIMSELTVGYGEVVLSAFADLGIRPNILAVADNIETMKAMVQAGSACAIVPLESVGNETALGVLRALPLLPEKSVTFTLFRRRQAMSRKRETVFSILKQMAQDGQQISEKEIAISVKPD